MEGTLARKVDPDDVEFGVVGQEGPDQRRDSRAGVDGGDHRVGAVSPRGEEDLDVISVVVHDPEVHTGPERVAQGDP
jgi:hypothetical protein